MIPQELIQRTEKNLELLASKMPEKFLIYREKNDIYFALKEKSLATSPHFLVIEENTKRIYICPDFKQQFSNAIDRIIYEAFGEEFSVGKLYDYEGKNLVAIGNNYYLSFYKNKKVLVHLNGGLESTEELSAQLEAMNLRIEMEYK